MPSPWISDRHRAEPQHFSIQEARLGGESYKIAKWRAQPMKMGTTASPWHEINEWQVAGIRRAIASLDRGEGIPHDQVKDWVASWGSASEKQAPKSS
jgi:predicted transcriptional regulator